MIRNALISSLVYLSHLLLLGGLRCNALPIRQASSSLGADAAFVETQTRSRISPLDKVDTCDSEAGECVVVLWMRPGRSCSSVSKAIEEALPIPDDPDLKKSSKLSPDPPLSNSGVLQAQGAWEHFFKGIPIDVVFSSPARKAVETAVLAAPDKSVIKINKNIVETHGYRENPNIDAENFPQPKQVLSATLCFSPMEKDECPAESTQNRDIKINFAEYDVKTLEETRGVSVNIEEFYKELAKEAGTAAAKAKEGKRPVYILVVSHHNTIQDEVCAASLGQEKPIIKNAQVVKATYKVDGEKLQRVEEAESQIPNQGFQLDAMDTKEPGYMSNVFSPLTGDRVCEMNCRNYLESQGFRGKDELPGIINQVQGINEVTKAWNFFFGFSGPCSGIEYQRLTSNNEDINAALNADQSDSTPLDLSINVSNIFDSSGGLATGGNGEDFGGVPAKKDMLNMPEKSPFEINPGGNFVMDIGSRQSLPDGYSGINYGDGGLKNVYPDQSERNLAMMTKFPGEGNDFNEM